MVACLDFLYQPQTLISCLFDRKVHGATWGPPLGRQDPGGPHVGHVKLAIWVPVNDNAKTLFQNVIFSSVLWLAMRCVGIIYVIVGHFVVLCETCRTAYTQRPLLGYRCVLNNASIITNLTSIEHAQCRWTCLSRSNCKVISYNKVCNYCELGTELCHYLEPNEEFIVNLYGKERRHCLEWVSLAEYDPQRAVAFPNGLLSEDIVAVARVSHTTVIYRGRYQRYQRYKIHVVYEDDYMDVKYDGEVLLLRPGCLTAWVPHSVANTIPAGAVSGGYIGEETLYVGRVMMHDGKYTIGYFRKDAGLAYYKKRTTMVQDNTTEILVLL